MSNCFHIIVIATITTRATTVIPARIMQLLRQQPHRAVYLAIVYRVWTENLVSSDYIEECLYKYQGNRKQPSQKQWLVFKNSIAQTSLVSRKCTPLSTYIRKLIPCKFRQNPFGVYRFHKTRELTYALCNISESYETYHLAVGSTKFIKRSTIHEK